MRKTPDNIRRVETYVISRGGEDYRINRKGELHIFGQMPNSIVRGWWFAGFVGDVLVEA